jgi:glycine betaine catabolism B
MDAPSEAVSADRLAQSLDPHRKIWDSAVDNALVCRAIYAETHDVRTFVFSPRTNARIIFEPGQFLTFTFRIDGADIQRCYTISSPATVDATISITVKRVPGGKVSPWLHANLKVGDLVGAEGPNGVFTPAAVPPAEQFLFLSGGSGITPLLSMTRTFADLADDRDIVFIHAARTPADIIMRDELARLVRRMPRLRVIHVVEATDGERQWPGFVGRVDQALLTMAVPDLINRAVMCCGPAPFMKAMKQLAMAAGVQPENYAEESFNFDMVSEADITPPAIAASVAMTFDITFAKSNRVFPCDSTMTILEAARRAGVPLASGCAKGLCGTCKSRKLAGAVDMKHSGGIRQREIDQGLFLPCCSRPLEDVSIDR